MRQRIFLPVLGLCLLFGGAAASQIQKKSPAPMASSHAAVLFKIRAITAFVKLDPQAMELDVDRAAQFLEKARAQFQSAGFEVQTIRLATQPYPDYVRGLSHDQALALMERLDALGVKHGLDLSVGPGIMNDENDPATVSLLTDILSHTKTTNSSVTVATPHGVQFHAVRAAAEVMKRLSTESRGGIGNFSFAAAGNCPPGIPFFPTAYQQGAVNSFALAIQTADLVHDAFAHAHSYDEARSNLKNILETQLQPVEFMADQIAITTRWPYDGMDISTAPLNDASIGAAIEALSGVPFGDHGTLAVAAVITDVLKNPALKLKRTGYSGLMIPVMEDATIARRAAEGHVTIDKLLEFSSVCATGIDVAPIPGDTPVNQIEKIILDVATLSTKLHKPLAVRLLVVPGKSVGEMTNFHDPFLVNTKVMSVE